MNYFAAMPIALKSLLCLLAGLTVSQAADLPAIERAPTDKPNIVFILADDLGIDNLSCYGVNVGARGHKIGSCGPEQIENGLSGLDALPGRPADTETFTPAGLRIGIDVHPRDTESFARQCPPR